MNGTTEGGRYEPKLSFSDIMAGLNAEPPVENPVTECVSLSSFKLKIINSLNDCLEKFKNIEIKGEIIYNNSLHRAYRQGAVCRVAYKLQRLPKDPCKLLYQQLNGRGAS